MSIDSQNVELPEDNKDVIYSSQCRSSTGAEWTEFDLGVSLKAMVVLGIYYKTLANYILIVLMLRTHIAGTHRSCVSELGKA